MFEQQQIKLRKPCLSKVEEVVYRRELTYNAFFYSTLINFNISNKLCVYQQNLISKTVPNVMQLKWSLESQYPMKCIASDLFTSSKRKSEFEFLANQFFEHKPRNALHRILSL